MRLPPVPADFAAPPGARRLRAWDEADRAARPARLARLRARLAAAGIDAYFGLRREEIRYLTGVVLGDGEEKVAGHSGRFLVTADEVVVLADSRYTLQARREAPGARVEDVTYDLPARWPELLASVGARRVAAPAGDLSHALWERARGRGAVAWSSCRPTRGSTPTGPSRSRPRWSGSRPPRPSPTGRSRRSSPRSVPGRPRPPSPGASRSCMREGGAEALAFDVATLAGPQAALPHGSPGSPARACRPGAPVRLRSPGRGLPERHDPDPVRRGAAPPGPRPVRPGRLRPGRRASRCSRRPWPRRPAPERPTPPMPRPAT